MEIWLETSLSGLYSNTVRAFPRTGRRQNSTDEVVIENIKWIPFRGMRTLFLKGLARREQSKNECVILFKGVKYRAGAGKGLVEVHASNGEVVFLEPLSMDETDVLVRCTCKDFHWRMTHFNSEDASLYGRDRKKYEAIYRPGSANPMELSGMCKHLIKMSKVISETGIMR